MDARSTQRSPTGSNSDSGGDDGDFTVTSEFLSQLAEAKGLRLDGDHAAAESTEAPGAIADVRPDVKAEITGLSKLSVKGAEPLYLRTAALAVSLGYDHHPSLTIAVVRLRDAIGSPGILIPH